MNDSAIALPGREQQVGDTPPKRRRRSVYYQPVMNAISAHIDEHGVPPTRYEVMAAVADLNSGNTLDRVIADLTAAGQLRKPKRPGAHRFLVPARDVA